VLGSLSADGAVSLLTGRGVWHSAACTGARWRARARVPAMPRTATWPRPVTWRFDIKKALLEKSFGTQKSTSFGFGATCCAPGCSSQACWWWRRGCASDLGALCSRASRAEGAAACARLAVRAGCHVHADARPARRVSHRVRHEPKLGNDLAATRGGASAPQACGTGVTGCMRSQGPVVGAFSTRCRCTLSLLPCSPLCLCLG
jgi:hypothetical protein